MACAKAQPGPSKTFSDQLAAPNQASKKAFLSCSQLGKCFSKKPLPLATKNIVRQLPCSSLPLSNLANVFKGEAALMDSSEVFKVHRTELRASGSHKDTVACHQAATVPHVL